MFKDTLIKAFQFEDFVLSIIRQKCLSQGKPFFAEYKEIVENNTNEISNEYKNYFANSKYAFDGFAPKGFDDFKGPVIIEVKFNPRNMVFDSLLPGNEEIKSLYIVSSETSEKELSK